MLSKNTLFNDSCLGRVNKLEEAIEKVVDYCDPAKSGPKGVFPSYIGKLTKE